MTTTLQSPRLEQFRTLPFREPHGTVHARGVPGVSGVEISRAIAGSVLRGTGLTFTVAYAHRHEKDALSTQLETLLLTLHMRSGGFGVKVFPAFFPFATTAVYRLQSHLRDTGFVEGPDGWTADSNQTLRLRSARQLFLSAKLNNTNVGGPGLYLLEVDEAHDTSVDTFVSRIRSIGTRGTGVTTVLYGAARSRSPLMDCVRQENALQERQDGTTRNFHLEPSAVALAA